MSELLDSATRQWRRERAIELSRRVREARSHVEQLEDELQALINNAPVGPGRASAFTAHVYEVLEDVLEAGVPELATRIGEDPKRIHNSLRTLCRQGLAVRVARGRWRPWHARTLEER